jgi:hypothetical protein
VEDKWGETKEKLSMALTFQILSLQLITLNNKREREG